jgi:hypothetical protein
MQNKINEYVSDRNLMKQGISTWANAAASSGGGQGTNQPIQEAPQNNVNYGQMQSDASSGQGMDNAGDMLQMGGFS